MTHTPAQAALAAQIEASGAGGACGAQTREKRKPPVKITAEQYVNNTNLNEGIGGLVRSMYGATIMTVAEWDAAITALRHRQVK
jgi:hypothetical protein